MERLIIIGSGPAGLTAAIYSSRAFLNPLVIVGPEPGGQLVYTTHVENYPGFPQGILGSELVLAMRKQAERFGARFIETTVNSANFSKKPYKIIINEQILETSSLIIASGARSRTLGLKNENKFLGRGVHTCATCDGAFYRNKEIMVIGGGDSAMEEAVFLAKFAKKVTVVQILNKLKASEIMQKKAKNCEGIEFIYNTEIIEYLGSDQLEGVKLVNKLTNQIQEKKIAGIFLAIGQQPNTEIYKKQLKLDKRGFIKVKDNVITDKKGIFAAGDVTNNKYRQAITAASFGCMAAIEVERYLQDPER